MTDRSADERLMRDAIRLSKRGFPAPNPHVGCVLVRDEQIVGRGYHDHAGGPHAEVVALRGAGDLARGSTAYVTLEPCNHQGRTGPCSLALVQAGVVRVVVAVMDPNPTAAGGAAALRAAGIQVDSGVLQADAEQALEQYLFALRKRRPLVVVKAAMSLDGRIALPSGESQWISGPLARQATHRLRAELGAVLVGRRTVEMDDPRLTARVPGVVNQPLRIVLDPQARLDAKYKVFSSDVPTLHLTADDVPYGPNGFDLNVVLQKVRSAGATGVLVEGGSATVASFLNAELVDRVELFIGLKVLGEGPTWVQGLGLERIADAPEFDIRQVRRIGDDAWITAIPRRLQL